MKKLTAVLLLGGMVAVAPAVVRADDTQILQSSAAARSGADRLGGATMTSPPHAWTGTGQSPQPLSTDDTRKETPRNPAVVGPPVPRQSPQPQSTETRTEQTTEQPANDQPSDQSTTDHN